MWGRVTEPSVVADGVVRLGTDLVNWFLVDTPDGVVAIDTGLPGYRPQLERGLSLLGRRTPDLAAVLLTHSHSDHIGGAEELRSELDVPVHVHHAEADATRTAATLGKTGGSQLPYLRHPHAWRLLGHFRESGAPKPVREVQAFENGATLPGGFRVVQTDGHTPGHVVFHLPERRVLFAGDHLCTTNPLTGARGAEILPRPLNESSAAMLASLERIEALDADVVLVGHGEAWTDGAASAARAARTRGVT